MSITHAEKGRLQKKVARYVWQLRGEMWLGIWSIDVMLEDYPGEDSDALAAIQPTTAHHHAEIEIRPGVAQDGGGPLRHVVVHELLHLYHRDASDVLRLSLPKELSTSAYTLLWEAFRQATELMVDDMAHAWAEHLSLPDWPKEDH